MFGFTMKKSECSVTNQDKTIVSHRGEKNIFPPALVWTVGFGSGLSLVTTQPALTPNLL